MANIAVLWDVENVTPSKDANYVSLIIDAISDKGRISYALAFGDWNMESIKASATELANNSFELIHVPRSRNKSADTSLVARGVELIFQYPHIHRFVLITGDADFKPLLVSLRKYGKEITIICDVKNNASEDLLKMSDEYFDYRSIIGADDGDERHEVAIDGATTGLSRKQAFELFREAISMMLQDNKKPSRGSVKIRMKLLNDSFDERKLEYPTWNAFLMDAMANTDVEYDANNNDLFTLMSNETINIPEAFEKLTKELKITTGWSPFTGIAKRVDYKKHGYTRFKQLALDAEKRGYVQTKNNGLVWYIRLDPALGCDVKH